MALFLEGRSFKCWNGSSKTSKTDLDSAMDGDYNIAKLNLLNKLELPFDTELVLTDTNLIYVPSERS